MEGYGTKKLLGENTNESELQKQADFGMRVFVFVFRVSAVLGSAAAGEGPFQGTLSFPVRHSIRLDGRFHAALPCGQRGKVCLAG